MIKTRGVTPITVPESRAHSVWWPVWAEARTSEENTATKNRRGGLVRSERIFPGLRDSPRGVDHAYVRIGLRKISPELSRFGIHVLGEEAHVIGLVDERGEKLARLGFPSRTPERVGHPERADGEG